ncbi:hypothetical protein DVH05_005252 [Phytophthora capsici]|nr:hypothetical protein DVH05_005252 [Phytophthora capsici]|eukprot:jgi/Phyca11/113637/e_gw1.24.188.1
MRPRSLDGVCPTALEALQQRREASNKLKEIDKLLRDDDEVSAPALPKTTVRCSFGSGRYRPKNPRYWLNKGSSVPGPGSYAVAKADCIVKPSTGGGGALGPRSGVCCRFQPCECKKPAEDSTETPTDRFDGRRQDTKQPRRSSPPLVAYSRSIDTDTNFETREQQRRVAAVQLAKQRWTRVGINTKPNYRWTERRVGTGGALSMGKSTSRDGTGHSAAKAKLRKLFIASRTQTECDRAAKSQ